MEDNNFIKYILGKDFRSQLVLAFAIFFGIVLSINLCLRIITRHNSSYPVPDFKGLTLSQAVELADEENLRIQVMDSIYSSTKKRGTVVEQEPKPGFKVKKNRRIFLLMNALKPEKVSMPNIVGVSLRQAMAILESRGLVIGRLRYIPDIATNNVLKQRHDGIEINAGEEIIKGSQIDLVLGKAGGYEPTSVPDVKGLKLAEAKRKIVQSYLNIGAVEYDQSVKSYDDSASAVVYKQKPDPEKYLNASMGTFLDIWLTVDDNKIKSISFEKEKDDQPQ
jgi:eukaryotic-like serine/threonine-protein kinase